MAQNRRMFLQCLSVFCLEGTLVPIMFSDTLRVKTSRDQLKNMLHGSWKLQSYTYTSNKRTCISPDEIEGIANFTECRYDVKFSAYSSAVGIKRTRHASESGTYSVMDNRIRLFAEEASTDKEKGEEFLTEVMIEGDTMNLKSNNGANQEVWKKAKKLGS